ncbi:MAG: exonuclease domain-containing protein [Candidatus Omnitrophota bacterium]
MPARSIDDTDLIFFDVETTGLNPADGEAICEIGAVKVEKCIETGVFSSLLNPNKPMPEAASAIHNIFDHDVAGAPYFGEVADKFLCFIGDRVICGYNVSFDLAFLNHELRKINYPPLDLPAIDILTMARMAIPNLSRYGLSFVAGHLNIDSDNFHRALNDVRASKEIFFRISKMAVSRGITTLGEFITLYGCRNEAFRKEQIPKIEMIEEKIGRQEVMQIRYVSLSQDVRTFIVIPSEISNNGDKQYLSARRIKNSEPIIFNIARILKVEDV